MKPYNVEKAEFWLKSGHHIVWVKESAGWTIIVYLHGDSSRVFNTTGHLPTITNAQYFAEKCKNL